MRLIQKLFFSVLSVAFVSLFSFAFAETVSFEVTLDPSTITAGEFTDLQITAIWDDGNTDTDYTDDIFIQIDGFELNDPDVELPGKWFGYFETSDQWKKIYSKGITIKKAGTYTVTVVDTFLNTVKGSATLTVNQEWSTPSLGTLEVTSPTVDSILTSDTVNVTATTSLPNTPIVLYIDEQKVQEGLSDANGDVVMSVSGISPGSHVLVMNAVDLWWAIVATSDEIPFSYEVDHGSLFVWLELSPSNAVIEWEKITAKITTSDVVDTVTIKIWEWAPLPTSKVSKGVFQKELLMEAVGTYPVWLWLSVDGSVTDMMDVDTITVSQDTQKILTLTSAPDSSDDKATLSWTYEGKIKYFKVSYGMNASNLDLSLTTTTPTGKILLTDPTKTRYAQVTPVDKDGNTTGEASETIQIDALRDPDPVCGNQIVEPGEECDDGNTTNWDGCSAVCRIQASAICGNRRIEIWEECDDGNINNNDGCSSICKIEQAQCGNGRLEIWEECDDGNTSDDDTCNSSCKISQPKDIPKECETGGIDISTKVVWWKYYLYRSPVSNAEKYLVYRQETRPGTIGDMRLVGETTDPLFEYPFDPNAAVDQYAWYAVEAVCDHSSPSQLGDFTKVKVWPEETIMMIMLSVLLLWGMVKLQGRRGA